MTKKPKVKYFGASDPEEKRDRSTEGRVNEFIGQDSIKALRVTMHYDAIIVLYEVIYLMRIRETIINL